MCKVSRRLGRTTILTYAGADLVAVTDPLNRTATLSRMPWVGGVRARMRSQLRAGRLRHALNRLTTLPLCVTDRKGQAQRFAYDSLDRYVTVWAPYALVGQASTFRSI